METDTEFTDVVFRKVKNDRTGEWEAVAFFPDCDEGLGNIMSYMHLGQHGVACMGFYYTTKPLDTRGSDRDLYLKLKKELETCFCYRLRVKKRVNWSRMERKNNKRK